tara:strand:- start:637 stop:1017 length:381 start_codon:yes stop_codon:yes gene_type:complete
MTITARLGRDPETKTTPSGKTLCKLTLPVDDKRNDTTTWWTATLWGKSAEVAGKHLRKGRWVCVSGEAHVRTYEKKDGSTGFSAELNANSFSFVGNRADDEQAAAPSKGRGRYSIPENVNDGSIPF